MRETIKCIEFCLWRTRKKMAEAENQTVQQVKQINDISWEDVELRSVDSNEVLFLMCYPLQLSKVENNQSQIDEK